MKQNYLSPGVYVQERSSLPEVVLEVQTAIPAFIGYTKNDRFAGRYLVGTPEKITSFKDFEERFGGPARLDLKAITIKTDNGRFVSVDSVQLNSRYLLYEAVYMYFANGGGECFVVSTGLHGDKLDKQPFLNAIEALDAVDDVTLLSLPEAVLLGDSLYNVQQAALAHCAKRRNRFAILDIRETTRVSGPSDSSEGSILLNWQPSPDYESWRDSWQEFRNRVGINDLSYGAAYTPYLVADTPVNFSYHQLREFLVDPARKAAGSERTSPGNVSLLELDPGARQPIQKLEDALQDRDNLLEAITEAKMTLLGQADRARLPRLLSEAAKSATDKNLLATAYVRLFASLSGLDQSALAGQGLVENKFFKDHALSSELIRHILDQLQPSLVRLDGFRPREAGAGVSEGLSEDQQDAAKLLSALYQALAGLDQAKLPAAVDMFENLLITDLYATITANVNRLSVGLYGASSVYRSIHQAVEKALRLQPPSPALAGSYAANDRARGVWKAPANVSLANVLRLSQSISAEAQEALSSDAVAGKSINALRQFPGKGYLVWGARTLDGNSPEWRYIPVRRFSSMVEESLRRATAMSVFEPNDAKLWAKVKALIDNYLLQKWKDGALTGAAPQEAYFSNVGLGSSMTEQDILQGRLIVDIGLAVVRPAEFIILRFMHKMRQS